MTLQLSAPLPCYISYVGLPVTTMVLIVLLTVHLTAGMHSCLSAGNASNLRVTSCLTMFTLEDNGTKPEYMCLITS